MVGGVRRHGPTVHRARSGAGDVRYARPMTDATDASTLIEFREWLVEWEEMHADNWQSAEKDQRRAVLKNSLGVQLDHVRQLVAAVIDVKPIEDRWNGDVPIDPFAAIFQNPRMAGDVITVINRAIGCYQRGRTARLPHGPPPLTLDLSFVTDVPLREVLERNAKELGDVLAVEAWTAAIVLAGSIAEGILIFALTARQAAAVAAAAIVEGDRRRNPRNSRNGADVGRWKFWFLVEVADEMNLIDGTRKRMVHDVLREFRNMIHPQVQVSENLTPDPLAARSSVLFLESLVAEVATAP